MKSKPTILITGVNGLIGQAIASYLLDKYEVIGTSLASANKTNLPIAYYSIDLSKSEGFKVLDHQKIDVVIHCGASLDKSPLSDSLFATNCIGVMNIAKLVVSKKCKQTIYLSGAQIIGKPIDIPITENHNVRPASAYHSTKYFGEIYLANECVNTDLAILRVTSPIGEDLSKSKILTSFIQKALKNEDITLLGKGTRVQNYVDVLDVAEAVGLVIQKNIKGIYNLAGKESYSNNELAELCITLLQSTSKIAHKGTDPTDDYKWIYAIEKAKKDFSYNPTISLSESILRIAKSYQL